MKKHLSTRTHIVSVLLVLVSLLSGCFSDRIPQEGTWRCDALNITISLEMGTQSTIVLDGQEWHCTFERADRRTNLFGLRCEDNGENWGRVLFYGECIELSDDYFLIIDTDTKTEYQFIRIS